MCVQIGTTIGNLLAAVASCLDGQQMVFIERTVLPHSAPPKVKIHKMAPWEEPCFGVQIPGLPAGLLNLEKGAADPLSGSVRFVANHTYSHVRCGLVDKMICELHGW